MFDRRAKHQILNQIIKPDYSKEVQSITKSTREYIKMQVRQKEEHSIIWNMVKHDQQNKDPNMGLFHSRFLANQGSFSQL